MASRNRGTFRPSNSLPKPKSKAKQQKQEQCEFEVKVVGGINESSTSNSKVSLQDLVKKLKESFSGNSRETLKPSKLATDENKQYVKCKLLVRGVSPKYSAFYNIRKTWFGNICQAGDPFWLESCEEARKSYRFQANVQRHSFDPVSCSLGSFWNRGTFVEHYNTEVDRYSMDDQSLYAEFQHDTKVLEISCYILTIIEFRLAFEYKQFENYVLVDEKQRGVVDIYIPLLRPPKVIKLERQLGKDRADEVRCVEFLSCSQEILGKSCVLKLSFESSDKPSELVTRLAKMSRTIYFCAVNTILPLDQVLKKPSFTDFRTAYALECLLSRGFKVSDRLTSRFYQMLKEASGSTSYLSMVSRRGRQLSSSQICRALYQLIAFVEANRFCPLETILEQLLFGKFKKNVAIDLEIPKHYVYVPRIIITPTQNYLVQPELVAENRVIREFGHEFAMRIAFREEDFSKLTSFSESLKDVLDVRVIGFLREGIHLCGRHFKFLACSNSQLRDHGAWLFAYDGQVEAEEIRKSLGKLDGIRCVATYVSRMGQCFSSTKESVKITMDEGVETAEIPDISKDYKDEYFACCQKLRSGTYTFSDGIGKISQLLAEKIAKSLDLKTVPSAFQIRYAGCKGMLAIDTSLPKDRQILQYRKSMRKFDSEHEGLEICEHSKPNALYLNRQCITLLSGMGVPDEALIKLQDTMLIRLASMLLFESIALETLGQTSVPGGLKAKALRNSGIMVTCEPFFRSLLLAIYKSKLNDLLRRARIAIPHAHGRLLIGVLDESQTLQYGQVFIRYSKDISEPNKEYVTLTGQVVVTKNPCFHPGDLRKFEAVDVKSLYHLVDCIVFPSRGPRPHTDEISGSDLDGDKYFATWYKPLIPPQPNAPPMDFLSPEKRVLDRKVEVDDMIQFVAEYIKNDQLGVIANAHLVHADSEDDGVKSDKCITLAHMHSDAVDFPKTGQCPSLTPELRPEQYPDFMMKTDKPRYKSKKVIGKLFQKCNQLERARYFMASEETEDQEQVRVDQDLVVPGHEEFMVSALESRDRYNTKLGSLMALYGLKDEGEVLTGCLTKVNSRLSGKTDEKFEVAQLIQASLASLRNNLKVEFYQEFGSEEDVKDYFQEHKEYPQDVLCKASAWYVVTYSSIDAQPAASQDATQTTEEDPGLADEWSMSNKPLLSFPWIVSPLLAYIKSQSSMQTSVQKTVEPHKELENISKLIIAQTKQMFSKENLRELMTEDLQTRHTWRDQLPNCSSMSLLGASMTGLNILDKNVQPMQLYCHVRWDTTTEMEEACLRKYEGFLRRSRIIAKLFIGKYGYNDHCMGLSFTTGQDKKHYIVANPFEMLKSFYIQTHIMQAPLLLPLLMVIMHWARKRYMTGSARDSFIAVEDLAVLFIKYCEHSQYIEEIQLEELKLKANKFLKNKEEGENLWKNTILESMEFTNQGFFVEPGLTLIKFWEFYGSDSGSDALHLSKIRNPVKPREKLLSYLKQEESQRFTDAALHTFHEIAQRRGLDSLLTSIEHENLKEVSETLTMPNCTWGSLRFAEDFVAHGLSTLTKAKVNIRSAPKGGGYIMEVVGNYISLSRCQAECHRLEAKTREHFVYDHVIRSGNRFIFLDQTSHDDRVAAKILKKGDFAVNLTSTSPTGIQIDEIKLLSAVKEQMDVYQNSYLSYLHGSKNLHISLEYGSIFVTNAHKWVAGTTVEDVEETLSKKSNAKNKKRNRNTIEGKFVELQRAGLDAVAANLSVFGEASHVAKEKIYVVEMKISNNHKLKVVLDKDLAFKGYQFEPFKWLDARLKCRRPASSRSSDVDMRIIMSTQRDLTTEEYENLSIHETFGKIPILSLVDGRLTIAQEYRRRATFVFITEVDTQSLIYNDSCIFLEVKKIKKYNAKQMRSTPEKEFTSLKLYVADSNVDSTEKLVKDILSLGKILKPSA